MEPEPSARHNIPSSIGEPVRTFRYSLCFTVLFACLALPASAQSLRRAAIRKSESSARAAWRPVRPVSSEESAKESGRLRRVDHHEEVESLAAPTPVADAAADAPAPPVTAESLDGKVDLAPLHDSSVACDALPSSECGCGSAVCSGGCDDMFSAACGSCSGEGCSMCGELCSPRAWRPCVTLCLPQDGWLNFELLSWWQDGVSLPPLITTSVDPTVPRDDAGVLTDPNTRILFGGGDILKKNLDGGRLKFGVWLDSNHTWGVGAELFEFSTKRSGFNATSSGDPILARPFFNILTGEEDSGLISYPGADTGSVVASVESRLSGAAFHVRRLRCCNEGCSKWLFCGCPEHFCSRTELLVGYRYLELKEGIFMNEQTVSTDPRFPGTLDITDRFNVRNQFNGFDVGWSYRRTRGFWTCDATLRLGIGNTRQSVSIAGQTTINDLTNPPPTTQQGGFLAQSSNIGVYRQNEFAVVPEFTLGAGYQLTDHFKVTLGYTFLYWSNVVRPGLQIDRDLNPNLFPPPNGNGGANRPGFTFDTTDYWAQGINFGGEYRW